MNFICTKEEIEYLKDLGSENPEKISEGPHSKVFLFRQGVILKIASSPDKSSLISYESGILRQLNEKRVDLVPYMKDEGVVGGCAYFLMGQLPGRPLIMTEALMTDFFDANFNTIQCFLRSLQLLRGNQYVRKVNLAAIISDLLNWIEGMPDCVLSSWERDQVCTRLRSISPKIFANDEIIHGDLNISNILVDDDLRVTGFIDFTHVSEFDNLWDQSFIYTFEKKLVLKDFPGESEKLEFFVRLNHLREARSQFEAGDIEECNRLLRKTLQIKESA